MWFRLICKFSLKNCYWNGICLWFGFFTPFLMVHKKFPPNHKTCTNPLGELGKTPYEQLKEEQKKTKSQENI